MAGTLNESVTLTNGVQMPLLGLGTWQAKGNEVAQAVRWALELGYRHIDTAAAYENEEQVGKAIRDSGVKREEIFVTTKLWNADQRQGGDRCQKAFDESLKRLGLDYIDLYLVHWPVKGHYRDAWRALEKLYAGGKGRVRAIGVSNFMIHHLEDVLKDCQVAPMVNQVEFHPRLVQRPLLEFCRRMKVVEEAWSPLIRGQVTELDVMKTIGARHNKTAAQVVLRWNVQNGVVTIPKSVRRERIAENAGIFDFTLSDDEMKRIDALDENKRIGPDPDNFNF